MVWESGGGRNLEENFFGTFKVLSDQQCSQTEKRQRAKERDRESMRAVYFRVGKRATGVCRVRNGPPLKRQGRAKR